MSSMPGACGGGQWSLWYLLSLPEAEFRPKRREGGAAPSFHDKTEQSVPVVSPVQCSAEHNSEQGWLGNWHQFCQLYNSVKEWLRCQEDSINRTCLLFSVYRVSCLSVIKEKNSQFCYNLLLSKCQFVIIFSHLKQGYLLRQIHKFYIDWFISAAITWWREGASNGCW